MSSSNVGVQQAATASTKDLKKSLGRKELFSVAAGQIIGAGIMALTGVAIAMTGRSVNVAFMLAAVAVIFLSIPNVFIASSIRLRGGMYSWAAVFAGKKTAGIFMIIYIIANISIAMYAISFSEYFMALIPGIPAKAVALIVMTLVFFANYRGVEGAAKLQNAMVLVLAIALTLFSVFGVSKIQPGYFENPGFLTNGVGGLLTAMALLTFATGGATVTLNLSAEAKNPKKDIPFVIIVSTLVVAGLYAFMSTIAAGVLPIEQVANQPLTLVAEAIMPKALYIFFVVGGAMFALLTTLNATVSWITKPVMQACVDNWFPQSLAALHPKYNTPYKLLAIFYIVGILPILFDFNIEQIANFALILNYAILAILVLSTIRLPKLFPEQWKKSPYHMPRGAFSILIIISTLVMMLQLLMLGMNLTTIELVGNGIILGVAVLFGFAREKHVNMEISVDDE